MTDLIDRQALDLAFTMLRFNADGTLRHWDDRQNWCMSGQEVEDLINSIPSVSPEPLTDKEQRIFLAAMSREEKVCKEVDELWRDSREPYEDSLVRTCHEIKRKVKSALWTN